LLQDIRTLWRLELEGIARQDRVDLDLAEAQHRALAKAVETFFSTASSVDFVLALSTTRKPTTLTDIRAPGRS